MLYHQENADVMARIIKRWRKTEIPVGQGPAGAHLRPAKHAHVVQQHLSSLLDQETDHGVKADELATLFEDLFVEPDAKAVVFSQWTRTHDIVIRRLEARGLGYVSFHGGVPSEKRPVLVERFRDDPACRVFRCGQHRPQSAACFDPREHGLAVEPGGPRTAHRAHPSHGPETSGAGVRREKAALSSGCKPHPATAPAGSNRSSHGGNEMAEAFGIAGHELVTARVCRP